MGEGLNGDLRLPTVPVSSQGLRPWRGLREEGRKANPGMGRLPAGEMRKRKGMRLNEIFMSIEGEGIRTGATSVFVRLHGCNLRCSYCDTLYAVEGDDFAEVHAEEIVRRTLSYGIPRATVTGGEPLIHGEIRELLEALDRNGVETNVETNGAADIPGRWPNVFYTMDWKTPTSGMSGAMRMSRVASLTERDVLKFVVGSERDLDEAESVVRELASLHGDPRPTVYVSPVFGTMPYDRIVEGMRVRTALRDFARFQVQLHKIVWDPKRRGV